MVDTLRGSFDTQLMSATTTKKTIAYLRVSTERQADGNGPEEQRMNIVAYAATAGIHINEWVQDEETGTTANRTEIQRVLFEAKAGRVGAVIISRMDRLGRTVGVTEQLFDDFAKVGVEIINVQHRFSNNAEGRLMRQMLGVMAEYDRSQLLTRMKNSKKAAIAQGGSGGGQPLYGYRSEKGVFVPHSEESELIKRVFRLRDQGMSYGEIVDDLFRGGLKTRRGGSRFTRTQIQRILRQETAYRGKDIIQTTEGPRPRHPEILTEAEFPMHAKARKERSNNLQHQQS